MAFYGDSDHDDMLREFGVPVTLGGVTVNGIVDLSDQDLYNADAGQFTGKVQPVLVKTGALPGLAEHASITVDGTRYTVIQVRQEAPDGAFTRVWLQRI